MTRWVGRLLGLLVLVLIVLFPAARWGSGADDTTDDATITNYLADFIVAKDGRLSVTETLTVSFPGYKHGIFRFFDLQDPDDSHARLEPDNVTVTRDGQTEPFETQKTGQGRYRNVQIGSASQTIQGEHVYVIRYTIDGVLSPRGSTSQFYWNLVPSGWLMPIDQARLTVHLPAKPGAVKCALGVGATSGCKVVPDDANGFVVTTGRLEHNTPVTVKAPLDVAAPSRNLSAWPLRLDPVLGTSTVVLIVLLLLAALAAWVGEATAAPTRELKPQFPLMYAPPDGLGPAQANYLFTEKVGKDDFVASIMQTSEKGATTLTHQGGWTITDTGKAASWQSLDPVSAYAAQVIDVQGGAFTADTSVGAGQKLKSGLSKFESATQDWAKQNKLMAKAGVGSAGGLLVIGGFLLAGFLGLVNPFGLSVLALVPGLFAIFAAELLAPGSSTRRTPAGRELWSRIGGFQRILATPSAEQRFDFSGRKELYTAYIPWAVAFGVADQWAEKYKIETGEDPPLPFYAAGYGYAGGGFASSMANDFSTTVDSAISAYEATQSSSSSGGGGGGFSGGGGGGGGGGGSW
ncbi:MAG: hypothetical protein JWR90_1494 [Marmoricola sp.]|nr:hypothetical protein [Marmoricola sp.]